MLRKPVILFEGPDYSGKSTLVSNLLKNIPDTVSISEPHPFLRDIIVSNDSLDIMFHINSCKNIDVLREIARYSFIMASRVGTYIEICNAICGQKMIFLDRSFPSSMVYQQSYLTHDIYKENINQIFRVTKAYFGEEILIPDLIIFLEISSETYLNRMRIRNESNDLDTKKLESIEERIEDYRLVSEEISLSKLFKNKVYNVNMDTDNTNLIEDLVRDFSNNFKGD